MDNGNTKLLNLLHQVKQIKHEYELTARITGENFNVFRILGLSTAEVRTHSAFLAELLNTKGSHGQGALYLNLFLQRLGIDPRAFTAEHSTAQVEHHIGTLNSDAGTGGRIDILLTDMPQKRQIIIENKIYARDQDQQLTRYHEFDKKAILLYLTLHGEKPSALSYTGLNVDDIKRISYKEHIRDWLSECQKVSVSLPVIRETIVQYSILIRTLTGQTKEAKVSEQAKNLILENPGLIDSIVVLGDAWQSILNDIRRTVIERTTCSIDRIFDDFGNDEVAVQRKIVSDGDGVCVSFRVVVRDSDKAVTDGCARRYRDALREFAPSFKYSPHWNAGWYNPKVFYPGVNVDTMPRGKVIVLANAQNMDTFVKDVVEEADKITAQMRERIRSL